jgi:hypothetical protein
MLTYDLAEAIADLRSAKSVSVCRLWREFLGLARQLCRLSYGTEFLDRTDADPIGLPKRTVYSTSFGYAELGAMHERRDIRRISIPVTHEPSAGMRFVNHCFEKPTGAC